MGSYKPPASLNISRASSLVRPGWYFRRSARYGGSFCFSPLGGSSGVSLPRFSHVLLTDGKIQRYQFGPPITNPRPGWVAISSKYCSRTVLLPALSVGALFGLEQLSSWLSALRGSVIFQILCHRRYLVRCIRIGFFLAREVGIAMLLAYVALPVRIVSAFRRQPVRLTILLRQVYDKRLSTHAITFVGCELRAAFSAALALGSSFSLERAGLLIALQ